MNLSFWDLLVILIYLIATIGIGFWLSKRASKNIESYFLGGNSIKWYFLGLSNASGMFDISGTMWTVSILFVYGLKSVWIPWLWPVWNQVFVMIFLAIWMRRSNVMTGAEWILTRFSGRGGRLSHIVVICFAVISVIGFLGYFFVGIGKFATSILPWDLSLSQGLVQLTSEQSYALIIIGITTVYTLKGGMFSVVAADIFQFVIMTISCVVVGYIAYTSVTAEQIAAVVPAGWGEFMFDWKMNLDWSSSLPALNDKIAMDGYEFIGPLVMMMLFKGVFASLAGPVPSYDMQRILSTKSPSEAAKMSGFTMLILYSPRYLMVAGFAVLSIVYLSPEFAVQGSALDFETILPTAIGRFVPVGFKGLLLAGLLAAFMGTLAAFVNSAPAYIVNDLYKKYINPNAESKTYVRFSYLASVILVVIGVVFGFFANSLNSLTLWITSSLFGGYAAANVLKWIWWRFNGYGYFWGMVAGLLASTSKLIFFAEITDIYFFPVILGASLIGCVLGTFMSAPDDEETLKAFYKNVKPWGFWGPIKEKVQQEDSEFKPNEDFGRDCFNVVVGIVWQMSLILLPIYLVTHNYNNFGITLLVTVLCMGVLKKNWYDRLKEVDRETEKNKAVEIVNAENYEN
ncbi:sodium:solute symporter family protein [Persicobacter diffluens]|uniref:Sodium:solute symporter n=1 Tax=Persicobacter diffluens TaxID=981 RepID=A0AAN5AL01_9BACT|nr:sodium:solute symporter [Persicobacter diffluens]